MKKSLFILAFAFVGFTFTNANAQSVTTPKLSYTADYVDYGTVDYGGPSEREWKFKNEGKEPLLITNATGSCGCTVPSWPKEPIMPGKEAVIKINYDTKRPGQIAKTVTITTNEPEGSNTHVIKVKGNVKNAPENSMPVKDASGAPVGK
jgi:hypothetical protein